MKRLAQVASAIFLFSSMFLVSCGGSDAKPASENTSSTTTSEPEASTGSFKIEEIQLGPVQAGSVAAGKSIYELKCQSCHKLTDEKLVGPGWKGITQRRKAGWIVSMITNPEEMLNNDAEAKKLLEEMLVKMPNQNLTKDEALQVVDFMRSNDGEK